MYLKEGSMREWKGWDILGGLLNEKMERLGVLEGKFSEVRYWKGWMYLKESSVRRWEGESRCIWGKVHLSKNM